jgi:acetyl esterase/lipase
MEAATVRRDLTYRQAAGASLELDVYTPAGPGQPRPAVLFVHGFPVPPGSKIRASGQYVSWSQLVAATSLAGVPLDWRGDPAELRDAIQYVRQHAPDLGINPDRLALFGFSAGGGPMLAELLRDPPPSLRCAVVYYGNLTPATAAVPSAAVERVPPLLVVRAGRDALMPAPAFDQFVAEASAKGARVETVVHPTGVHAFDLLNDDDTSRDIVKQTLTFLATHLTA